MKRLKKPIQVGVILVLVYAAIAAVMYRQVAQANEHAWSGVVGFMGIPPDNSTDPLAKVAWDADKAKADRTWKDSPHPSDFLSNALVYGFAGVAIYVVGLIALSMRPSGERPAPPQQAS